MSIPVYTPPAVVSEPPREKVEPPPPGPMVCRIHPMTVCPEGESCVLTNGESGICRPDSETSLPRADPR